MPRSAFKWLLLPCLTHFDHAPKSIIVAAKQHSCHGLPQKRRYSTARERERAKSVDRFYSGALWNDVSPTLSFGTSGAPPSLLPIRSTNNCATEADIIKDQSSKPPRPSSPPTTSGAAAAPVSISGDSLPKTEREETIRKARVIFGSRLAGPAERRRDLDSASMRIAGILVPPRPDEPDNCCMSGCVNCVWDRYRDELEEWAEKSAQARHALQAQRAEETAERARTRGTTGGTPDAEMPAHVANSMDDDGGGSEALWTGTDADKMPLPGADGRDLFAGVPVGIREFMRTEKKLKEMRQKQRQVAREATN